MSVKQPECDKINQFDSLYTNNHIQILKIVFCGLTPDIQRIFAPFIKFLEFQYAMSLSSSPHTDFQSRDSSFRFSEMLPFLKTVLNESQPYLNEGEKEKCKKFSDMFQMFQSFQNIQSTLDEFEKNTGIKLSDLMSKDNDQMDFLQSMLNSDMKSAFDIFK